STARPRLRASTVAVAPRAKRQRRKLRRSRAGQPASLAQACRPQTELWSAPKSRTHQQPARPGRNAPGPAEAPARARPRVQTALLLGLVTRPTPSWPRPSRPTRGSGVRLLPASREILRVLDICPWIPIDVLVALVGARSRVSVYQALARLRAAGLVQRR